MVFYRAKEQQEALDAYERALALGQTALRWRGKALALRKLGASGRGGGGGAQGEGTEGQAVARGRLPHPQPLPRFAGEGSYISQPANPASHRLAWVPPP